MRKKIKKVGVPLYQLTYFDTKENCRKKYLNGTSWENMQEAENEYLVIKPVERARKRNPAMYSPRIKWALEVVKDKKRVLVKMLSR